MTHVLTWFHFTGNADEALLIARYGDAGKFSCTAK